MQKQMIVVYDFETGGKNPNKCEPTQVAAIAIDPVRLEPIRDRDGEVVFFNSHMTVRDLDALEEDALNITGKTRERIEADPDPGIVWENFDRWVSNFNLYGKRDYYTIPISAGHNIWSFDKIITERMCQQYGPLNKEGDQNLFNKAFCHDTLLLNAFLHNGQSKPDKFKMDVLRPFYGLPTEGGHDGLVDVKQTAIMLIKFLKLAQRYHAKVQWEGSMKDEVL